MLGVTVIRGQVQPELDDAIVLHLVGAGVLEGCGWTWSVGKAALPVRFNQPASGDVPDYAVSIDVNAVAGETQGESALKISGPATLRRADHGPARNTSGIGLAEGYACPVSVHGSLKVLQVARIVLKTPGDGTIYLGCVHSHHRVAQKKAGELHRRNAGNHPGRRSAHDRRGLIEDQMPYYRRRLRIAGYRCGAGKLESIGTLKAGGIAHHGVGQGDPSSKRKEPDKQPHTGLDAST